MTRAKIMIIQISIRSFSKKVRIVSHNIFTNNISAMLTKLKIIGVRGPASQAQGFHSERDLKIRSSTKIIIRIFSIIKKNSGGITDTRISLWDSSCVVGPLYGTRCISFQTWIYWKEVRVCITIFLTTSKNFPNPDIK